MWEMACLAGFLNGREVAKRMVARDIGDEQSGAPHKGTIIFTGATASLRGSANFAGFAGAKMALRGLAQSMARELGPMGVHVAHTIIDGMSAGQQFLIGIHEINRKEILRHPVLDAFQNQIKAALGQ